MTVRISGTQRNQKSMLHEHQFPSKYKLRISEILGKILEKKHEKKSLKNGQFNLKKPLN